MPLAAGAMRYAFMKTGRLTRSHYRHCDVTSQLQGSFVAKTLTKGLRVNYEDFLVVRSFVVRIYLRRSCLTSSLFCKRIGWCYSIAICFFSMSQPITYRVWKTSTIGSMHSMRTAIAHTRSMPTRYGRGSDMIYWPA